MAITHIKWHPTDYTLITCSDDRSVRMFRFNESGALSLGNGSSPSEVVCRVSTGVFHVSVSSTIESALILAYNDAVKIVGYGNGQNNKTYGCAVVPFKCRTVSCCTTGGGDGERFVALCAKSKGFNCLAVDIKVCDDVIISSFIM